MKKIVLSFLTAIIFAAGAYAQCTATIALTSAPGTDFQTVCENNPITNITYSVGGGATGATVSGLPAGVTGSFSGGVFTISGTSTISGIFNYTVTTTGSCVQATANGSITVNPLPVIVSASKTDVTSCSATDGTLTINATGANQYSIDGGGTFFANGGNFTSLASGAYPTAVRNSFGCIVTGPTLSITAAGAPAAPVAGSNSPVCEGATITLYASTVVGATYDWTGPGGYSFTVQNPTIPSSTPLMSGTYSVTVTVSGCTSPAGTVSVTVNPKPTSITTTKVNPNCGIANGSVTLGAVTGGVPPYYYNFNNTGFSTQTYYDSLQAGSYSLIVSDSSYSGCSFDTIINLNSAGGPTGLFTTGINSTCSQNNGSINIDSVQGGLAPYTYSFNGGTYSNQASFTNLTPGCYIISVKDSTGCTFGINACITGLGGPYAYKQVKNETCGMLNGELKFYPNGGTRPYQYSLNGGAYTYDSSYTGLPAGTYNWIVKDANGCVFADSAVIQNLPCGVTIRNIYTQYVPQCSLPARIYFNISGDAVGYNPTLDSIDLKIQFGDGTDSSFTTQIYGPDSGFYTYASHVYNQTGQYSIRVIATGPDGKADTLVKINEIILNACGNISGKIFSDNNVDCAFNGSDALLKNIPVLLYQNGNFYQQTYTDTSGNYLFSAPVGFSYEVKLGNMGYNYYDTASSTGGYQINCPAGGSYTITSFPSSGNDFSLSCKGGFDLDGNVSGWRFRPGSNAGIFLSAFNHRCLPVTGQAKLVLDPKISYAGTSYYAPPDMISGDTLIWNLNNLSNNDYFYSYIYVNTQSNANIGDSVCLQLILVPLAGDSVPENNDQRFCFPIRNSYDPNEKLVTPPGIGITGDIPNNTEMTYTVNFQNTGNDTAYNIVIRDTLDANLNPASFKLVSSSHAVSAHTDEGNIAQFTFNNIMLVDSFTNEPLSHGYVTYKIAQLPDLAPGTQIQNTASIYFDYNAPIVTNTVLNTISNVVVPVTLLSFNAVPVNNKFIKLTWATANEININSYVIERAVAGSNNFISIGSIAALQTSNTSNYLFNDNNVRENITYQYRLRIVENNRSSFSEIRLAGISGKYLVINIGPNPVLSLLNVNINSAKADNGELSVMDVSGKIIYSQKLNVVQGVNSISVNMGKLSAGTYILKATLSGNVTVKKFSKR